MYSLIFWPFSSDVWSQPRIWQVSQGPPWWSLQVRLLGYYSLELFSMKHSEVKVDFSLLHFLLLTIPGVLIQPLHHASCDLFPPWLSWQTTCYQPYCWLGHILAAQPGYEPGITIKINLRNMKNELTCSLFRFEFQSMAVRAALTNIPPELI